MTNAHLQPFDRQSRAWQWCAKKNAPLKSAKISRPAFPLQTLLF